MFTAKRRAAHHARLRRHVFVFFALVLVPLTGWCAQQAAPSNDVINTDLGAVRGMHEGTIRVYRGIPYAAPPTGAGRWRAPAPAQPWPGVRDASDFGSPCVQPAGGGDQSIGDEDCLTLNVWVPPQAGRTAGRLPVMFYIHGGDNVGGASSLPNYDGKLLAENAPAVVVTLNYRLGAFGFLPHPSFRNENPHGATGNYALLDQIAALQWVRRNIHAFGGDPERVMVFGTSAGSVDTCALIASPLAAGLFSRALMQSGPCTILRPGIAANTAAVASEFLGCHQSDDEPACLRAADAGRIALVPGAGSADRPEGCAKGCDYNPFVDGYVLPETPLALIAAGRHNHMPIITSTTDNEYGPVIPRKGFEDPAAYPAAVELMFGTAGSDFGKEGGAEFILKNYPVAGYETPWHALVSALNDRVMTCPARRTLLAAATAQSEPVWRYLWAYHYPDGPLAEYRAGHGFDVDFIFGHFLQKRAANEGEFNANQRGPSAAELKLSQQITGYLSRFAATGNPNGAGAESWPEFEAGSETYLSFSEAIEPKTRFQSEICSLHDTVDLGW